jgi:cellulose/xylan binding protein with CBM9 domain
VEIEPESPAPPTLDVASLSTAQRLVSLPPVPLRESRSGHPPRLSTALRVGLRAGALVVRFDGRDERAFATLRRRDAPLWTEDVFEVFLSPGETPRIYFEFEVNPLGTLFDARVESPDLARATMRADPAWSCPGFSVRVRRRERLWSALLRIPLAPLCGTSIPRTWRANFYRVDRGDEDEFSAWSPTFADPPDFHVPRRFGTLRLGAI